MPFAAYATYFFATALPRAASFLLIIVMTRFLPVEAYGAFALALVLGDIMESACSGWVRILLLRDQGGRERFGGETAGRFMALATASALVAAIAGMIVARFLDVQQPAIFGLCVASYVIANALSRFALTVLQLRGKTHAYGMIEGARAFATLLVVPGVALLWSDYALSALALNGVTLLSGAVGLAAGLRGGDAIRLPRGGYRSTATHGLPIVIVTLLTWGISGVDRFFLQTFTSSAAVGLYSAAYVLGRQPVEVIAASINLVGFPALVAVHAKGDLVASRKILADNTMLLLAICPFFAVLFMALSQQVCDILLPVAYHSTAFTVTPLAVLGATFMCLKFFVFDNIFHVVRRNWLQILCLLPGAGVTILLDTFLVGTMGATGVAIGYLAGAVVALGVTMRVTARFIAVTLSWRDIAAIAFAQAVAGGSAFALATLLQPAGSFVAIVPGTLAAFAIYGALLILLRVGIMAPIVDIIRRKLGRA